MGTLTQKRRLVLSCTGLTCAFYLEHITVANLNTAWFFLDCSKERGFHDGGDVNYLCETYGGLNGVLDSHRVVYRAIVKAAKEGRVAWRDEQKDGWEQLNELLTINGGEAILPPGDLPYSPANAVTAALGADLPYFLMWQRELQRDIYQEKVVTHAS